MSIDVEWGSATDVGRVRELNEDSVFAHAPLFLVADGMGGHAAGEVASGLALGAMRPLANNDAVGGDDVLAAIDRANTAIVDWSLKKGETRGMGTTLCGLCLGTVGGSPHWFVFNVGDSRVYRYSEGAFEQLTNDHSEVGELLAAGQLTPDEARFHPNRHVITRSLGSRPAPTPDMWVIPARGGESYLVCSDGLTTEVDDLAIEEIIGSARSAQDCADDLCARALAAGGHDNVSVVVVRMPDTDASTVDIATAPRRGVGKDSA